MSSQNLHILQFGPSCKIGRGRLFFQAIGTPQVPPNEKPWYWIEPRKNLGLTLSQIYHNLPMHRVYKRPPSPGSPCPWLVLWHFCHWYEKSIGRIQNECEIGPKIALRHRCPDIYESTRLYQRFGITIMPPTCLTGRGMKEGSPRLPHTHTHITHTRSFK